MIRHMEPHRALMMKALKDIFVPELRSRGFSGTFPHFRRITSDHVDYLTFQFLSSGGSFVVEVAKSDLAGNLAMGRGADLPVSKLNAQFFSERLRLGGEGPVEDWFVFGPRSYDPPMPERAPSFYAGIASRLVHLLDTQAEEWWRAR
ncbi:MAG TPA: DUF4304 domain-containing protein [Luteimonas sp.]|nr:DUF4304 domain-containing protein [Luteimonas sp.]